MAAILSRLPYALRTIADPDAIPAAAAFRRPNLRLVTTEATPLQLEPHTRDKHGFVVLPSSKAYDLIALSEGFEAKAYLCPADKPTIGYGHTYGVTHADVRNGRTITKSQARVLLIADVRWAAAEVAKLKIKSQSQFDALVSLVFNIGAEKWNRSTLRRHMLKGRPDLAAKQFGRWIYIKGKVSRGLTKRRMREAALFAS